MQTCFKPLRTLRIRPLSFTFILVILTIFLSFEDLTLEFKIHQLNKLKNLNSLLYLNQDIAASAFGTINSSKMSKRHWQEQRVDFYVYDNSKVNWLINCSKITDSPSFKLLQTASSIKSHWHHADDILFSQQILKHKWRTKDPDLAQVFVIPTLFGWFSGFHGDREYSPEEMANITCNGYTLSQMIDNTANYIMNESPYFNLTSNPFLDPFHGRPHLFVASSWYMEPYGFERTFRGHPKMREIIRASTFGHYEIPGRINYNKFYDKELNRQLNFQYAFKSPNWRCTIVVPYVDWPYKDFEYLDSSLTFENWRKRSFDFFFVGKQYKYNSTAGRYDPADAYRTRRIISDYFKSGFFGKKTYIFTERYDTPHLKWCQYEDCDVKRQCANCTFTKELIDNYENFAYDSKFALVIHGGTSSTSRLYDAITNGQIPIIISTTIAYHGLPFVRQVPWLDLAFFISQAGISDYELCRHVREIAEVPEYILKRKFERLVEYRKDVSWRDPESKVIDHILEDAKDTCRL